MQKKSKHSTTSQSTGRSIKKRKSQSSVGCKELQQESHAKTFIADSIFTVAFKPKKGIEVVYKQSDNSSLNGESDNYEKMYYDLLECVKNALKLLGKEDEGCVDVFELGMSLPQSLNYVLSKFETHILPKEFGYNIDQEAGEKDYFFTIYRHCDSGSFWHSFEIKYVLEHLKETNTQLYDLYVQFIISFHHQTQIDFWFGDTMNYCYDWLQERMEELKSHFADEFDGQFPEEESEESIEYNYLVEVFNEYTHGAPKDFEAIVKTTNNPLSVAQILTELEAIKENHPIKEFIRLGCDIMNMPYNIWDFRYDAFVNYDDVSLDFEMQYAITWDSEDQYSAFQMEMIDATAREGVQEPCLFHALKKTTESFDLERLENGLLWPKMLTQYWLDTQDLLNSYRPKNTIDNER